MPAAKRKAVQRRRTREIKPQRQHAIVKAPPPTVSEVIEQVLIGGNLASLSVPQRLEYYNAVCKSLGLNPLTRPFEYIAFEGKLQLYARKDCTEQLRKIHGIAVVSSESDMEDGMLVVHVKVQDKHGRTDTGTGAVDLTNLKGKERANAIMKCETKAKRRATLSMAGLGFLDESELDTVGDYGTLTPGGRIATPVQSKETPALEPGLESYLSKLTPDQRAAEEEALARKSPAQREVMAEKLKSVNPEQPKMVLPYVWDQATQTARIEQPNFTVKDDLKAILLKLKRVVDGRECVMADVEQFNGLQYECEQRGIELKRRT
jgi:hypothetical protein